MVCQVLFVLTGTGLLSIVLWQNSLANKIEILSLAPMLAITCLYYRHLLRGAVVSPEIVLMVILAAASVTWSTYPAESLERSIPLIVTTAFGLALGSMMSLRGLLLFIATFFGLSMVLAMGAIIALPQARGIPPWGDTWNGIYMHKNGLGAAATDALLSCTYAVKTLTGKLKTLFVFLTLLSLFLLIASESRTSQILAVVTMSALYLRGLFPNREIMWAICFILISLFLVGMTAFVLTSPVAEPLFALIGRKPTLSDRIPLWEVVWPYAMDRFWLGYGYVAHWYEDAQHLRIYFIKLAFQPFYSHNGLIETFLNVGFVGVALFFLALMRFFYAIFYSLWFIQNRDSIAFTLILGMMFVFGNITESFILERLSATWMFFVAYATKMNLIVKTVRTGQASTQQ
jgi:O-antigen ligase